MIHCLSFFIISFYNKANFFSYFLPTPGQVTYIAVAFICCYVTLSLSEAAQIKVTTTVANLPFMLLEKLLKNCKTLRKGGANRLHVIL